MLENCYRVIVKHGILGTTISFYMYAETTWRARDYCKKHYPEYTVILLEQE